MKAKNKS